MSHGIVIVGHSHITALSRAAELAGARDFDFLQCSQFKDRRLPRDPEGRFVPQDWLKLLDPVAVCLCLGGNWHNVVGLIEAEMPFVIGEAQSGAFADQADRWFIPHAMMADMAERMHEPFFEDGKAVFEVFPNARRFVLCAPPPVGEWEHIARYPGTFADQIHRGPMPARTRLTLYEIQCASFVAFSQREKSHFIPPDPLAIGPDGFLTKPYWLNDAVHANDAYGALMLAHIGRLTREKP